MLLGDKTLGPDPGPAQDQPGGGRVLQVSENS